MSYKGRFKPRYPAKYNGNAENIIYRSLWELQVMQWLDRQPGIIWWSSEELAIPYLSPVDNRKHRYFPDFIAKMKTRDGTIKTVMMEVKPLKQTKPPTQTRKTRKYIAEAATYAVNQSKFAAAREFCKDHGWEFQIITEKELGMLNK
jgi:hypothetical protein